MTQIPLHQIIQISDCGVQIRKISSLQIKDAVHYAHRDDYYMFGIIIQGSCKLHVDFKDWQLQEGEVMFIQPGQVHSFVDARELEAYVMIVDSVLVNENCKKIFDEYSLCPSQILLDESQQKELICIFDILSQRLQSNSDGQTKYISANLATAATCIIAEAVEHSKSKNVMKNTRLTELMLKFRRDLKEYVNTNRKPSFYASRLHVSVVYLNEIVNKSAGMSATQYILNEWFLEAKRQLVYSHDTIQEIGNRLGVADSAYFTKLFTKLTGVSPSSFRNRNLE